MNTFRTANESEGRHLKKLSLMLTLTINPHIINMDKPTEANNNILGLK